MLNAQVHDVFGALLLYAEGTFTGICEGRDATMRVFLADNQPQVRVAIDFLLDLQPNVFLVGAAETSTVLLEQIPTLRPDLVLVNWELWRTSCAQLRLTIRTCPKCPRLIVFSSRFEVQQAALNSGADAFFCLYDPPETFINMLQTTHALHGVSCQ